MWNYTLIYGKWTTNVRVNADFRVLSISKLCFCSKSKDLKRQYPAMLSRFFDFIKIEQDKTLAVKCKIFYDFASKLENRRMLESQIMSFISFQEERVKIKKEIAAGTLRNYIKALKYKKSLI